MPLLPVSLKVRHCNSKSYILNIVNERTESIVLVFALLAMQLFSVSTPRHHLLNRCFMYAMQCSEPSGFLIFNFNFYFVFFNMGRTYCEVTILPVSGVHGVSRSVCNCGLSPDGRTGVFPVPLGTAQKIESCLFTALFAFFLTFQSGDARRQKSFTL